jgi:hypothetical protein
MKLVDILNKLWTQTEKMNNHVDGFLGLVSERIGEDSIDWKATDKECNTGFPEIILKDGRRFVWNQPTDDWSEIGS